MPSGARARRKNVLLFAKSRTARPMQDNARSAGVAERIQFRNEDLFAVDLSEATVVMLFLSPEFNLKLRPRLQALKSGTRIVSHWHNMGDWTPQKALSVSRGWRDHAVYLWVIP
jgi:hypothetical protein